MLVSPSRRLLRVKELEILSRAAARACRWKASVNVNPPASLIDEKNHIQVRGLVPRENVTLRAKVTGDSGERFASFAHYIADEQGKVCVSSQPSVGGSYTGVEPMGLLWSMKPSPGQKEGIRLLKKDVTKPYIVNLDVFDGHLRLEGEQESVGESLTSATFEKSYMKAGVRRIPVKEGRVRGTLFLPPGDGPFPGVLEFKGAEPGRHEFQAALLASHGFAVLAVAFFGIEDLPKKLEQVELEYFEEAARTLLKSPHVLPDGVGVISISKGSEFALMLAAHSNELVKAVIAISSSCAIHGLPFYYMGKPLEFIPFDFRADAHTEEPVALKEYAGKAAQDSLAIIPVELINCPVCLVCGTDDQFIDAPYQVRQMQQRMEECGKSSLCSVLIYPGAGHVIEPPYTPLFCISQLGGLLGVTVNFGGTPKPHAVAQEEFWNESLAFLKKHLLV